MKPGDLAIVRDPDSPPGHDQYYFFGKLALILGKPVHAKYGDTYCVKCFCEGVRMIPLRWLAHT
jgi:hypothetical protein